MAAKVANHLARIRQSRGISAAHLASQVGISRQTIYAIEAGSYMPNTEVTLKLARALEVKVEDLFALRENSPEFTRAVSSEILTNSPVRVGQAVNTCRIGEQIVAVPASASPYYLPEADGIIRSHQKRTAVTLFSEVTGGTPKLVWAGCDPAAGLIARTVERTNAVELLFAPASSRLALRWLQEGKVHIAGCHLRDEVSGEFNLPFLAREFPGSDFSVITFAHWEEGFVTLPGNPKAIKSVEAFSRKRVRLVNREPGSGSRALLDTLLAAAGLSVRKVAGYNRIAQGHLAAAYAVQSGEADCCLATRSAALAFGLGFVPVQSERYDLVARRETLNNPALQSVLDALQRASLRRKLESIAGYDTAKTGTVLA